jgi:tRNA1Val (adenine37-N6)-methyltransferase
MFQFKYFSVQQANSALKVGTDAMLLGAYVSPENATSCLDIGAGTGVISLMLAQQNPSLQIHAIEIDTASVIDCQANFTNSKWNKNLTCIAEDFLTWQADQQYDLIVSNPPFYQNSLLSNHTLTAQSKHAVFLPFEQLFEKVSRLLAENGVFWLIVPFQDLEFVSELGNNNHLMCSQQITIEGKPGKPVRVILAFQKKPIQSQVKTICIRTENGNYTSQYIELTKEFHSKNLYEQNKI